MVKKQVAHLKGYNMKCQCCKGEGGEREHILDDGSGPYYECGYCKGEGEINIFKYLKWWFMETYLWK